jgi:hypothetical protein
MTVRTHPRKSSAAAAVCFVGAALLLSGCATKPVNEVPAERKIVLMKGEFEYVYVTGSRVPVLVPLGQAWRAATLAASPVVNRSAEALEKIQNQATNFAR